MKNFNLNPKDFFQKSPGVIIFFSIFSTMFFKLVKETVYASRPALTDCDVDETFGEG